MVNPLCVYCEREITPEVTSYQRIQGWERVVRVRSTGTKGGSDISAREKLPEFACSFCVDKLRDGVSPYQETLA